MSSLPASPNPQRSRGPAPARKARTARRRRTGTAPPAEKTETAAAEPSPAAAVRIPYRQWKGPRPRVVNLSFALIVLAGIISLAGGITAARSPVPELPPAAAQLEQLGIEVSRYAAVFQAMVLATAVVVFGVYLLFAFMVREGRNWARIGGSVLAVPALAAATVQGEAVQAFALLAAVGGLALLYRSDCSRYFRPRQDQYRSAGP